MPFRYCPESAFVDYTPILTNGQEVAGFPLTNLQDYYRPDLFFRGSRQGFSLGFDARFANPGSIVSAVALLDPTWVDGFTSSFSSGFQTPGISALDWRTGLLLEDPAPHIWPEINFQISYFRIPNPIRRGPHLQASTLIFCREWNELGVAPTDPIRRRRLVTEPFDYLTIEEDWEIEVDTDAEKARWQKIRREWDQLYLWDEDGTAERPRLFLARLLEPPQISQSTGRGVSRINCTWQAVKAAIRT